MRSHPVCRSKPAYLHVYPHGSDTVSPTGTVLATSRKARSSPRAWLFPSILHLSDLHGRRILRPRVGSETSRLRWHSLFLFHVHPSLYARLVSWIRAFACVDVSSTRHVVFRRWCEHVQSSGSSSVVVTFTCLVPFRNRLRFRWVERAAFVSHL